MTVSASLRFAVLARDGFECVYCHSKEKPLEVDHVRPVALGGTDAPENLVAACDDCNGGKAAAHLGSLESLPRPTALHQSGELAFLQRRYEEGMEAANRAIARAEQAEQARKATAKQLHQWQERARAAEAEALETRKKAAAEASGKQCEISRLKRQIRLRGDLLSEAAQLLDAFDAYVEEQGGDPPPWKEERLENVRLLAQDLSSDPELGLTDWVTKKEGADA